MVALWLACGGDVINEDDSVDCIAFFVYVAVFGSIGDCGKWGDNC